MSCSEHRRFHKLSDYRLDMLNSDLLPAIIKVKMYIWYFGKLRDYKTMP